MNEGISHSGVVERVTDDRVFVRIVQLSACSGCHAQSMCSASEKKEKVIEVPDRSGQFQVNDPVVLIGRTMMGMQSVVLAFVIACVFVVTAIVVGALLDWPETMSGLIGLVLLSLYYVLLYFVRDKLRNRFVFTLKKLNN